MDDFAVIFKNPGEDHIIIPNRFLRIWGHALTNPLTMKTSFDLESIVSFKKVDNTLWLDRGWSAFARDYESRYRDVILFQYTGDSNFVVSFFKPCGLEKPTPLYRNINSSAQFFKPFMKNEYFDRMATVRNPLTIYCDNGDAIEVEFIFFGEDIWLHKGWKDVSTNCGIQLGDFLFFKYTGESRFEHCIVDNKEKPMICTRKRGLVDVEPILVHERTLWFTKITKAVERGTQPLNIPAQIVREWFTGKPNNIDIMLPSGENVEKYCADNQKNFTSESMRTNSRDHGNLVGFMSGTRHIIKTRTRMFQSPWLLVIVDSNEISGALLG